MNHISFKNTFQKPALLANFQIKYPTLSTFLIRLMSIYLVWEICFHIIWQSPSLTTAYRHFSLFVIQHILNHTAWLLESLYYSIEIELGSRIIRIVDTVGVTVGEPCIGFGVMAIFLALIISYPGHANRKMWFIPLGLLIIYTTNVIRIALLAIIVKTDPAIWELNHKFIFKLIIYSIVFLLWKHWMHHIKMKSSS